MLMANRQGESMGRADAACPSWIRFCNVCGSPVRRSVPVGDHRPRLSCSRCGHVQYNNPTNVVGIIPEAPDGRILMCRRATQPGRGGWMFPGGFLESGETSAEGAAREAREETRAEVEPLDLFMVVNAPSLDQVYLIHRGRLCGSSYGPTAESSEVALLSEQDIPWGELAFPSIGRCLRRYFLDRQRGEFAVHLVDLI